MVHGTKLIPCLIALTGFLGLWPSHAVAQTTNPTQALFDASADHNATDSSGTPLVQSYEIGLYMVGASQPFQRVSIGKPNPDGTGTITVNMTTAFLGWPIVGASYTADVAAVGSSGAARSALSNTFSFTGSSSCSFTVSSTPVSALATSASYTTAVATTSGCAWTGVSNAAWITVTSGGSGTGNGSVAYAVAANTSTSPRTGTLTIAGRTVTVAQAGTCSFTLTPTTQSVVVAGGSQSAAVTTTSGCAWTGVSNSTTWITVTGGSSGTGNGTVAYNVTARTLTTSRTGTLTIAGKTLTVTQSGTCGFTLSSNSQTAPAAGGPLTTAVTTTSGCAWTGVSNAAWITVTSSGSITSTGTARYTVAANPLGNPRTGTLTIAGQTVTITQVGVSPPSAPINLKVTH
jgi:hypothetical protein